MIVSLVLGMLCLPLEPQATDRPAPRLPLEEQYPWLGVLNELKFYGDFRLRHESSFALDGKKDRNRQRLRLRFGVNYQITDELLTGTRVVTGNPDDPNSPHVTLGDAFNGLDLSLDRAFLTYRPLWWEGAFATAGKFNHPFYRNPVYGELVWDADVQPEGIIAGRSLSTVPGFEKVGLTVGAYKVLEQGNASDTEMIVGELRGRVGLGETTSATLATSYYYYGDTTPDGASTLLGDNAGNAVKDTNGDGKPDAFASDFGVWNTILGVDCRRWRIPVTVSAEYIENTRADVGRDSGWAAGVALGSTARKGDWRGYYQWQVVEQEAVFSAFAQDDFLLATNHRSHILGVNYQLTDKVGLHLWALVSARDETSGTPTTDSDADQWRIRLDLNVKL